MAEGAVTGRVQARGAADRVPRSHAQTRATVRLALAFIAALPFATVWASSRWLPLHLFLAGAVMLAISGVSLMLTVTWSAAPAPPQRWVVAQRTSLALGAAGVGVGREAGWADAALLVSGAFYLAGLLLLAGLLVATIRRGVERRFDMAVASYATALLAGTAGVGMGLEMAIGEPTLGWRSAHVTTNLLGLVGLVVSGTMPYFAATVVRSKMSPRASRRRLGASLLWMATATLVAVVALARRQPTFAAIGLGAYAVGVLGVLESLPRPTRRQLRWAGPRLVALWAGGTWWAVAVAMTAADAAAQRPVFAGRWVLVLVVAGYAQILWGSLAYLLPMLRGGGHERLGEGFTTTRSWFALGAANLAGLSAAVAAPTPVTAALVGAWLVDSAWRAARVGTAAARRTTPAEAGP